MNPTAELRPPYRGNKAITILRIFLWLLPSFFLPLGVLLGVAGAKHFRSGLAMIAALVLTVCAVAAIGYFEHRLALQQKRKVPTSKRRDLALAIIDFVLLQIVITPIVVFAFGFGIRTVLSVTNF